MTAQLEAHHREQRSPAGGRSSLNSSQAPHPPRGAPSGLARNGLTAPGPPPNEDGVKKFGRNNIMQTKRAFVLIALTATALSALSVGPSAAAGPKIAVDLTTLTSPFWTAYNQYIVNEAKAQGVDLLQPFNSEFDTAKQI